MNEKCNKQEQQPFTVYEQRFHPLNLYLMLNKIRWQDNRSRKKVIGNKQIATKITKK